jgi:hypothetical protein
MNEQQYNIYLKEWNNRIRELEDERVNVGTD